jgi:drug/metabolite transporter (DMT)-like permease
VTASDQATTFATGPAPLGSRTRGFIALATAVSAWGIGWPVNRAILYHLPAATTVAVRNVIAAALLIALAAARRRLVLPDRRDVPVVLSISLLHMTGYAILVTVGLLFVPVGRSIVLAYTTPLWVTPGAALFLGERLTRLRTSGVILGLAGIAVLFNPLAFDWRNGMALIGNGVLLIAAVLWAASILHIRAHRWRTAPFDLIPWEMALSALVLGVLALATDGWPPIAWTPSLAGLMLYSAVPGTVLAFWASAVASRDLPAVTTSLGLLAAPVIGIVTSAVMLGEAPTWSLALAVVLIIGGITLGGVSAPRCKPSPPLLE